MRIGILTGGGDCPGLNAVIRAVVKTAHRHHGIECVGIEDGYQGLVERRTQVLDFDSVSGILQMGGTILGTNNQCDPFRHRTSPQAPAVDRSNEVLAFARDELRLDALVAIGGDGTLHIANKLHSKGLPVVGVPKTIDNDLHGTDLTFGHDTAVAVAAEALDRLRTTAEAHHRAMIVEVMGRNAGWLALRAALAAGGDVVLIPEIPFRWDAIVKEIQSRHAARRRFSLIVVAEGAKPHGGAAKIKHRVAGAPEPERLGGIGEVVAAVLRQEVPHVECRVTALGHVQRGGTPTAFDRVLATQFGVHAAHLLHERRLGRMVAYKQGSVSDVPITEAARGQCLVPPDHPLVHAARCLGMTFGDPTKGSSGASRPHAAADRERKMEAAGSSRRG